MRLLYDAYKGGQEGEGFAKLTLERQMLRELENTEDAPIEKPKNNRGYGENLSMYNLAESVKKDVDLTNYGIAPTFKSFFPIVDSFGVFGRMGKDRLYTGFMIDLFNKNPTIATAYMQNGEEERVQDLASQAFKFENNSGGNAYTERNSGKRILDLSRLGEQEYLESMAVDGEIYFGGPGKNQSGIVAEFMENCNGIRGFTDLRYGLKTCRFGLDFKVDDGKEVFNQGVQGLQEKIQEYSGEKLERYASSA